MRRELLDISEHIIDVFVYSDTELAEIFFVVFLCFSGLMNIAGSQLVSITSVVFLFTFIASICLILFGLLVRSDVHIREIGLRISIINLAIINAVELKNGNWNIYDHGLIAMMLLLGVVLWVKLTKRAAMKRMRCSLGAK